VRLAGQREDRTTECRRLCPGPSWRIFFRAAFPAHPVCLPGEREHRPVTRRWRA